MNYYIHQVPGRIRIRTPIVRGNILRATAAKVYMNALPGVLASEASAVTGSILVEFDTDFLSAERIIEVLTEKGYLPLLPLPSHRPPVFHRISVSTSSDTIVVKSIVGISKTQD